jgi:glycosyltransferase involved in cell wall biosynthesis
MNTPKISVVIPCFKTGARASVLVSEITETLASYSGNAFEVIMVVDGSPDDTWLKVSELARLNINVRGINLMRNYGQHSALLAGIRAAKGDVIVTIDDDLQHSPRDIPTLIENLSDEIDIVYGISFVEEHSFFRNLLSRTFKIFIGRLLQSEGAEIASAFRAFKKEVVPVFEGKDDLYAPVDVMLSWFSSKSVGVLIHMNKRQDGSSNYTFRSLLRHALNAITGYSIAPLRLVSLLGVITFGVSFMIALVVLVSTLMGKIDVAGFPTIAILVSMFAGVQILSIGIIGEYLGRLHMRSMGRPRYVIRDEI